MAKKGRGRRAYLRQRKFGSVTDTCSPDNFDDPVLTGRALYRGVRVLNRLELTALTVRVGLIYQILAGQSVDQWVRARAAGFSGRGDGVGDGFAECLGGAGAAHVGGEGVTAAGEDGFHGAQDGGGGGGFAEVVEHHGSAPDLADGVGDSASGDVRGRSRARVLWFPRNRGGFPMPLPAWSWIP